MVSKRDIILIILLLIGAWYFFPSDARVIKNQLNTIASKMSFEEGGHPIETAGRAKSAVRFMAVEVNATVNFDNETKTQDFSRAEIQQFMLVFGKKTAPVKVSLKDISVEITDSDKAVARFTALVERTKNDSHDAQEIETFWKKEASKWLLYKVSNVRVVY